MFLIKSENILANDATRRRSFVDVIKAKVCNIMPTPAEEGFTLAEILITLGIIGVVAAMTIPNLINAYKAKQLRTRFNK